MMIFKRAVLTLASGLLLQFGTCGADLGYYLLQALVNRLITSNINVSQLASTAA